MNAMSKTRILGLTLVLAVGTSLLPSPADAHYGGWGWGGFAAGATIGAIVGGLAASNYYYAPSYYYDGPVYYEPYGGDSTAYCMRRFRSYDPGSGTYLGFDGYRHPCP